MLKGWAVVVLGVLAGAPAFAADHLVGATTRDTRLAQAEADRAAGLVRLTHLLSSPTAERAAARVGANLEQVRRALPALTDAEIRDLSARAEALGVDPSAGLTHDVNELLIIFLIVAIVILVLKAV